MTAARHISEGMTIGCDDLIHGVNKIEGFLDDFIMITIEQLSVYTVMYLISRCKNNFVIPLVVGPRYIFYPHWSAMFTIGLCHPSNLPLEYLASTLSSTRVLARVSNDLSTRKQKRIKGGRGAWT